MADYRRGNLTAAADGFAAARQAYASANEPLKAAEMANNLCVALVSLGRGEEAVQAVEGTAEVFARAGDRVRASQALGNLASALEAAGRLDRAQAVFDQAIEGFRSAGDREGESQTWHALSRLQLRLGQTFGAAASAQAALDSHPRPGIVRRVLRSLLRRSLPRP